MEFIGEYALLVVVAAPVAVIVVMNLALSLAGESGTLLFPSRGELPQGYAGEVDVTPALTSQAVAVEAANDEIRTAA